MRVLDYGKVLQGDFGEIESLTDVIKAIHTVYEMYQDKIPREVINDALYRVSCKPDNLAYAKQQLKYMVNWANN